MSTGFNLQPTGRAFGQDKTFAATTNRLSVNSALTASTAKTGHIPKERFNVKTALAKTTEEMVIEEIQRKRDLKAKLK